MEKIENLLFTMKKDFLKLNKKTNLLSILIYINLALTILSFAR